jgi:ribosomal protein S18 acetylase RimI-like enzyme
MADEIIIRECLYADIEQVLAMWQAAEATASSTDAGQYLRIAIDSSASYFILAESGGRIVGSLIGTFDGWRREIYRMAVHPDFRRRGLARRLAAEAERWMAEKGAKRITALVEREHPWATGFWEAAGYDLDPGTARYARDL